MKPAGFVMSHLGIPPRRLIALGGSLIVLGALGSAADAAGVPTPPAGTASVHPDSQWLSSLTGQVLTDGAEIPASALPPGTPVTPVGGDPKVLVPAEGSDPTAAAPTTGGTGYTSALTSSGIPVRVLRAYLAAAGIMATHAPRCHLPWSLLAGIGRVETDHGRYGGAKVRLDGRVVPAILGPPLDGSGGVGVIHDTDRGSLDGDARFDRAVGPMQFLPGTWQIYSADGNGDGSMDPQNIDDAALAAARYLCAGGTDLSTTRGRWNAVFRYNHSARYVSLVIALADSYASGAPTTLPSPPSGTTPPSGPPASVGPPPSVPLPPLPQPEPTRTPVPTLSPTPTRDPGPTAGSTTSASSTTAPATSTTSSPPASDPAGGATTPASTPTDSGPATDPETAPPTDPTTSPTSDPAPSDTSSSTPSDSASQAPSDSASPTPADPSAAASTDTPT